MSTKTIIVANWKMNPKTLTEAKKIFDATKKAASHSNKLTVIIAPPSVFLRDIAKKYRGKSIGFAAQNVHFESNGSFTGELSVSQVKDAGATHVLVGHAERRAVGETNDDTRHKVAAALSAGISPILCIGEGERDPSGKYLSVLSQQILTGLTDVPKNKLKNVIIAYEPVWAIGGNEAMDPHHMHQTSMFIQKTISQMYGLAVPKQGGIASAVPVLYGGAILEAGDLDILTEGEVQGLLIGRASIDPLKFSELLHEVRARV